MSYTIKYKTKRAKVEGDKPTQCMCCGKTPKKGGLHAHHTKYEFTVAEVRKNPELAKKNVIWLCYHCHRIANCLRIISENSVKANKINDLTELMKWTTSS
jgi:hypothetical protein